MQSENKRDIPPLSPAVAGPVTSIASVRGSGVNTGSVIKPASEAQSTEFQLLDSFAVSDDSFEAPIVVAAPRKPLDFVASRAVAVVGIPPDAVQATLTRSGAALPAQGSEPVQGVTGSTVPATIVRSVACTNC